MKKRLILLTTFVIVLALSVSSVFAVTQEEYDEVVRQRDALYQQLVDAGIEPVVKINKSEEIQVGLMNMGGAGTSTESLATKPPETEAPAAGSDVMPKGDGWEVVKAYKFKNKYVDYYDYLVALKNTSGADKDVSVRVLFQDKEGNVVGVQEKSEYAFANEQVALFEFRSDVDFEKADVSVSMRDLYLYETTHSMLESKLSQLEGKVIVSVKNTGDKPANFVTYRIVFLDEAGNMTEHGYGYIGDMDSQIKPGATELKEVRAYEPFKSAELYVWGRRDKEK